MYNINFNTIYALVLAFSLLRYLYSFFRSLKNGKVHLCGSYRVNRITIPCCARRCFGRRHVTWRVSHIWYYVNRARRRRDKYPSALPASRKNSPIGVFFQRPVVAQSSTGDKYPAATSSSFQFIAETILRSKTRNKKKKKNERRKTEKQKKKTGSGRLI